MNTPNMHFNVLFMLEKEADNIEPWFGVNSGGVTTSVHHLKVMFSKLSSLQLSWFFKSWLFAELLCNIYNGYQLTQKCAASVCPSFICLPPVLLPPCTMKSIKIPTHGTLGT